MMSSHGRPPWLWGPDADTELRDAAIAASGLPPERPSTPAALFARASVPLGCGLANPEFGALEVGAEVVLARHETWSAGREEEDENTDPALAGDWVPERDAFVGRPAHVIELVGLDPAGCPVVHVDADDATWLWRVRDLRPPS